MANSIMYSDVQYQLTQEIDHVPYTEYILCSIQHFLLCSTGGNCSTGQALGSIVSI